MDEWHYDAVMTISISDEALWNNCLLEYVNLELAYIKSIS